MATKLDSAPLLNFIVDRINIGVFVLTKDAEIVLWNHFMEIHSGLSAKEVVGKNLFDLFSELPRQWLERKIKSVFILKNFAFTSWEHRPYLFKFPHNRPVTGGVDSMRQNCTFLPVKNNTGDVDYICVTLIDATDTSIYQSMMQDAVTQLNEASNRDGLTGVFNRRYLEQVLNSEFNRAKRYEGALSFILIDLDNFKRINDEKGHVVGDEVLRRAAEILSYYVRGADTFGRYGGEEFAVVLPQTKIKGAMILAERLRSKIASTPITYKDTTTTVTISVGVVELNQSCSQYERLIQEADTALYLSKEQGRNRVTEYKPEYGT